MKKLFFLALLICTVTVIAPGIAAADEAVSSFHADITINKDASIDVVETINYEFGAPEYDRHGIIREIPTTKTNKDGEKFRLTYELLSVTDAAGTAYVYTDDSARDTFRLKIGDPDIHLTGLVTYVIRYRVSGAITYFSDHDELYWNVTGNGWEVPILKATAAVSLPAGISSLTVDQSCYTAVVGSTTPLCTVALQNGLYTWSASESLSSSEGLSIVIGFPVDQIAQVEPEQIIDFWDRPVGIALTFVLAWLVATWYLVLPGFIALLWWLRGRDPQVMGPVTAWYDPPLTPAGRELTPGEAGTLIDETAGMKEITATIIDLSQRGYLKIVERSKENYTLVKQKGRTTGLKLLAFEQTLLDGLFKNGDQRNLKNADLTSLCRDTTDQLYQQVIFEGLFPKNPEDIRLRYTILGVCGAVTLNVLLAVSCFIFGVHMARKTREGAEAAAVARSLRRYLTSQTRQLEFQADRQIMFERLLPYAVAFGVEKIWAKRFDDLQLQSSSWYEGHDSSQVLTAALLTSGLSQSFSQFRAAATVASSTTGFSSGLSSSGGGGGGGGGYSGGGGGGGGGSSW